VLLVAALCPHPPLLVPQIASGAAPELAGLRTACTAAVDRVLRSVPDLIVLVGPGALPGEYGAGAWGTLGPYGVPVEAELRGARTGEATLPLSLTIGAWLLNRLPWTGPVVGFAVAGTAAPAECAALGASLANRSERVGMVVLGDGSARRSVSAPGYLDERAEGFDATVAAALRDGDPGALLRLDAGLADELLAAGRPAWQVLAGAAGAGDTRRPGTWRATVDYAAAPYGVAYLVASWTRDPRDHEGSSRS
jgi:hypothetical protein